MSQFNDLVSQNTKLAHKCLGGVSAIYTHVASVATRVMIDYGVSVTADNGLSFSKRTVISIPKSDVPSVDLHSSITIESNEFIVEGFVGETEFDTLVYVS